MAHKYAYYPGCSLHSTGAEYDMSFRAVCNRLGIELQEPKGWICCGATPAHSTSRLLSLALPMKSLCQAEKTGLTELVAPCAACLARLKTTVYETSNDQELAEQVSEIIDEPIAKNVKVLHPLEIFTNEAEVAGAVTRQMPELKVVCYYGCLLTRPPKIMQFDECEYPMSMDLLLRSLGITTLDWSYKTDCCGGVFTMTETDVVLKLIRDIFDEAKAVGANAIAVACPMCHINLDTRQGEVEEKYNTHYGMPILYFTQLMGLAYGISPKELGMQKMFVNTDELLAGMSKS